MHMFHFDMYTVHNDTGFDFDAVKNSTAIKLAYVAFKSGFVMIGSLYESNLLHVSRL